MNHSCNSILCRFGIHSVDPYVHIQVKYRNGSHRWQSNYQLSSDDLKNGNTVKLPREQEGTV